MQPAISKCPARRQLTAYVRVRNQRLVCPPADDKASRIGNVEEDTRINCQCPFKGPIDESSQQEAQQSPVAVDDVDQGVPYVGSPRVAPG
jgi:hypothetical protein